jgi:hypothetical protein
MVSLFRRGARALDELYPRSAPDHVLAMWAAPSGILATRFGRRRGVPVTTWCLGSDVWTLGRYPILRGVVRRCFDPRFGLCRRRAARGTRSARRSAQRSCLPADCSIARLARPWSFPAQDAIPLHRSLCAGQGRGRSVGSDGRVRPSRAAGTLLFGGGRSMRRSAAAARPDLRGRVTIGGYADEAVAVSGWRPATVS